MLEFCRPNWSDFFYQKQISESGLGSENSLQSVTEFAVASERLATQPRSFFIIVFCSTSLILLELDGFDQHYQASVHFPQACAIDKSLQHQDH